MNNTSIIYKIASRNKNYHVSVYIEHIINKLGRIYKESDIVFVLKRLQKQGAVHFTQNGKMINAVATSHAFA